MTNEAHIEGIEENRPPPANIVIFGATGYLTKRKFMQALARMYRTGLVHPQSRIIGVARDMAEAVWLDMIRAALDTYTEGLDYTAEEWEAFAARLRLVAGDLDDDDPYARLAGVLDTMDGQCNAMFYLAIPPEWYVRTAHGLGQAGLAREDCGYRRIVIEKPFGLDHASSIEFNRALQAVFTEAQIFRIDHYLGKESVQNLFVFRFGNSILEPLWNRNDIDHVQISVTETLGVEYRAPNYEKAGALCDMIPSHMMQVLTLVAMEPPGEYTANAVRDEKVKVLRSLRPTPASAVDRLTVAAQYGSGEIDGPPYVREPGVSADSVTETFAAVRLYIDNWRWQGDPFILWYGKRLKKRASEIVIRFRQPPTTCSIPAMSRRCPMPWCFACSPTKGCSCA